MRLYRRLTDSKALTEQDMESRKSNRNNVALSAKLFVRVPQNTALQFQLSPIFLNKSRIQTEHSLKMADQLLVISVDVNCLLHKCISARK